MSWVTKAFTWGGTGASDLNPRPVPKGNHRSLVTPALGFLPDPITGTTLPTPQKAQGRQNWGSLPSNSPPSGDSAVIHHRSGGGQHGIGQEQTHTCPNRVPKVIAQLGQPVGYP